MKAFYHSADLDGHCSGAVVKRFNPSAQLIGINYGDEFPWERIEPGETVFMVDFSLQPFDDMVKLFSICNLVWIDHHISAICDSVDARANTEIAGLRLDGTGACQLVWNWFNSGKPIPLFVKLLAEWDVWDHSDPRTLSFQYGMRQYDTDPENQDFWKEFFDVERVNQVSNEGGLLLRYETVQNEKYCSACSFETELDGLRCIAINKMLTDSKIFDSVWDSNKYDAMLSFGWRHGGWTVSLYSDKPSIDVSAIAKSRGGGGHKGAAGFQCETLPFELK